ncbi:MAG: sigma-70 family RNA polymerase sigma factor [Planctomycetota bacterium]
MNRPPDTRVSLIIRLPDAADVEAWRDFAESYEPFVYRFARRRGLQDADAREVVQEVFLGVARAIRRWEPDTKRARFRTWLFRIAKNQLLNKLSSRRKEMVLDTGAWERVEADAASDGAFSAEEEAEYQQAVFSWAATRIEKQVKAKTWSAFWMTSVEGKSVDDVASQLGVSAGQIYVARSRVIRKLREEIARFESEGE